MLAEMGGGGKSARRFNDCHQIFQTGKSAGRNRERNLWADLVTVMKSASQVICWQIWEKGKSSDRFSDCYIICQK